jgi:UDP-3-O-[3-hydroxymyristoyl] glucosamine N-acyltransferase
MGKRRFFDRPSGLTIAQIVSLTGAESPDATRLSHLITDVAPIDLAGPTDITFIESRKYADALAKTRAGACLMLPRFESCAPDSLIVLRADEPTVSFTPNPCAQARCSRPMILRRVRSSIPPRGSKAGQRLTREP